MRRRLTKRSFTLVETIMVIVILGIVAGIGAPLIVSATDALSI
jgi:prepilin-type N-terminal cleavage/methylation domain-containing protein